MQIKRQWESFSGAPVVKGPPANAGDTVWSLVWEDPTSYGAAKPVTCNSWAHSWQLLKPTAESHAPQQEKPQQWEAHISQWRAAPACHD